MLEPASQDLSPLAWTVRPAGDLSAVPGSVPRQGIEAQVPGCVHADLLRAHLIAHPDRGMAELDQLWVGRTGWEYRCTFDADNAMFGHDRVDVVFECLDTIATVMLNGVEIGRSASAFVPHRFDTRKLLHRGRNELVVTFTAPIAHIHAEDARLGPLPRNGDWDPFNCIRKPACDFGWDWGPKTAMSGISGPVRLEAWSCVRLESVRTVVQRVSEREWTVAVLASVERSGSSQDRPVLLRAELDAGRPDDFPVKHVEVISLEPGATHASITIAVQDPVLWWPRGHVKPTPFGIRMDEEARRQFGADAPDITHLRCLHDLRVSLETADGETELGAWPARIGFRTVELDTSPDEHGEKFAIRVNGREIFCTGANWVPPPRIPQVHWMPADYIAKSFAAHDYALVRRAADAGMNMLRVWGGGRYESEAFYEACDEQGILVWQDFMFACALYAEEEPLRSLIEQEARHQVTRLSSHPSVVLWCGGNETVWGYQRWGWKERVPEGRTWGAGYWTKMLPDLMRELDPTRPYWANSPWSGSLERDVLDPDRGDRHTWDAEFEGYRASVPRFLSEFGRQGPANYSTLARAIGPEHLRVGSHKFEHRQRATGGTAKVIDEAIERYFGKAERSFDEWHYLAQLLQARAVKIGVSWARCTMPRCSGVLVWQLNDVWACPSWSLIDAEDRLKPAYFAFKKAAAARACFFHDDPKNPAAGPRLFAVNDTDEPWETTVLLRRVWLGSDVGSAEPGRAEVRVTLPPRSAGVVGVAASLVGAPADARQEMLVLDVPALGPGARDTWLFAPERELVEPAPRWKVVPGPVGDDSTTVHLEALTVMREAIVQADRIDAGARAQDQVFTLLPGERATVTVNMLAHSPFSVFESAPVVWCAGSRTRG